jgi:hypothetical protein
MINIVNSRKGTLARDNARTVLEAVITASFEVFASIEQSRAEQSRAEQSRAVVAAGEAANSSSSSSSKSIASLPSSTWWN